MASWDVTYSDGTSGTIEEDGLEFQPRDGVIAAYPHVETQTPVPIIQSPDGTQYTLTVGDDGNVQAEAITGN